MRGNTAQNKPVQNVLFVAALLAAVVNAQAQEIQPLPAALQALAPANVFPSDAEKAVVFKSKQTEAKAAAFTATTKSGLPFFTAENFTATKNHFDVNAAWRNTAAVKKGDVLLSRITLRSVYAKQESGDAVVYYFIQQAVPPGERSLLLEISIGPEWKTLDIPLVAPYDMPAGNASIGLTFGALAQKVELAGIQVLNFGKEATLAQMPATRFTYAGREEGAAWRKDALKRIEEIRTAPLNINVVDARGKPVSGAKVEAKLVQSDFIWGTAVKESMLASDVDGAENYRRVLKEFFNTGVIENGFKAGTWQGRPERREQTMKAFEWLERNGFRQRGHNLVWPGWKFNAGFWKETALKDTAAFRRLIEADIQEKATLLKGRVIAWDVINEPWHERDFFPYLPTGSEVAWYKMARRLDPSAQLFINEYSMLNNVASPQNIQTYLDTIASFRKAGAPIDAIGIQGHVGRQPRNPVQVLSDLDMFRQTGLPVQITEFDINMADEELQADYTRDFLIACYSHPVVTGFTKWGFWQNAHWKPDAAMFRADWTPKPSAAVWREWVTKRWKTSLTETTNKAGEINSRGHLGKYEVTVTKGSVSVVKTHQLTKEGTSLKIVL